MTPRLCSRRALCRPFAALTAALAVGLAPLPALAGTVEAELTLPVRARLDVSAYDSIALAPFLVVTGEEERSIERRGVDVEEEFEGYLLRLLRRQSGLRVLPSVPVDYPSYDLQELARNAEFWRVVGERSGADLILTGSLDFDIQDRSGYRTEEYVSDGRPYLRQVLVEQTGFEYDIIFEVFDGRTGELLFAENFKDFKSFEGEGVDPLTGMFENLFALEDRILGVFAQRRVETTRTLLTP